MTSTGSAQLGSQRRSSGSFRDYCRKRPSATSSSPSIRTAKTSSTRRFPRRSTFLPGTPLPSSSRAPRLTRAQRYRWSNPQCTGTRPAPSQGSPLSRKGGCSPRGSRKRRRRLQQDPWSWVRGTGRSRSATLTAPSSSPRWVPTDEAGKRAKKRARAPACSLRGGPSLSFLSSRSSQNLHSSRSNSLSLLSRRGGPST